MSYSDTRPQILQQKDIPIMRWPPNSPDLNPIENLWHPFKKHFHKWFTENHLKCGRSKEALQQYADGLRKAWAEIGLELARRMVSSMPRRIQAVIAAVGGPTKY